MSSQAQSLANCANAQLSTGPKTPEGKSVSSLNAVKTGLTGRTVLLPGDDAALYTAHIERLNARWDPATDTERALVQSIGDTEWRLLRIPALEMGIYALGRREFAAKFAEDPASIRESLLDAHIFLTYRRDLNNLSIQEARLRRQHTKDVAELLELQEFRHKREETQRIKAAPHRPLPGEFGFEFTDDEIRARFRELSARRLRAADAERAKSAA